MTSFMAFYIYGLNSTFPLPHCLPLKIIIIKNGCNMKKQVNQYTPIVFLPTSLLKNTKSKH